MAVFFYALDVYNKASLTRFIQEYEGATMEFCDMDCMYATFPTSDAVDGSRSCRTFVALYCKRKTNNKVAVERLNCHER